jgi:hypothetical protein
MEGYYRWIQECECEPRRAAPELRAWEAQWNRFVCMESSGAAASKACWQRHSEAQRNRFVCMESSGAAASKPCWQRHSVINMSNCMKGEIKIINMLSQSSVINQNVKFKAVLICSHSIWTLTQKHSFGLPCLTWNTDNGECFTYLRILRTLLVIVGKRELKAVEYRAQWGPTSNTLRIHWSTFRNC